MEGEWRDSGVVVVGNRGGACLFVCVADGGLISL